MCIELTLTIFINSICLSHVTHNLPEGRNVTLTLKTYSVHTIFIFKVIKLYLNDCNLYIN